MQNKTLMIAGLIALITIGYLTFKKGAAGDLGAAVGGAAVDLVVGATTGAVETIGQAVGIPKTSLSACEAAKASGSAWDASFACPASDFASYVWNR
jgi:hypothetical protein